MLLELFIRHDGVPRREYVILRGVVVPLAHDFFGFRVMKRGEGLVGKFAHQVLGAVDFKWIELGIVGSHWLADVDCFFDV